MTGAAIDIDAEYGDRDVAADPAMGTAGLPGREAIDRETLLALSQKSDAAGLARLAGHLTAIAAAAALVWLAGDLLCPWRRSGSVER